MLLYLLILSALGSIVEYKFRANYGQIFYDYSGNSRHGVNGDSKSTTTGDTKATDRGAVFSNSRYITLPSNDAPASAFTLSSTFTITIWHFNKDSTFTLFSRISSDTDYYFNIKRNNVENSVIMECKVAGYSTGIQTGGLLSFERHQWLLITISMTSTQLTFYQNTQSKLIVTLPVGGYSESGTYNTWIGDSSMHGYMFIWYFAINTGVISPNTFVTTSATTVCLTGPGTCACSDSDCQTRFIDPDLGTGYMSSETSTVKDAASNFCQPSLYGCSNTLSLNCLSSSLSCIFSVIENRCQSIDLSAGTLSIATCACIKGYSDCNGKCCEESCSDCDASVPGVCTACRAAHTILDATGCKCSDGFFGTAPLNTVNSCNACYSECATCASYGPCLTCVAFHATKVTGGNGCACNSGYKGTSPLNTPSSCYPCFTECSTCNSSTICNTCNTALPLYLYDYQCQACHNSCLSCSGGAYYQCIMCNNHQLEDICIDLCPIGYISNNTKCIVQNNLAVKFVFDSKANMKKDAIYGLETNIGYNRFYPESDQIGPILTFDRGVFFTGNGTFISFPTTSQPFLMFGLRFFISIWMNPISSTSTLVYKEQNSNVLFSIKSLHSYLTITLMLNAEFNYTTIFPLKQEEWNHITLAVTYASETFIQFTINQNQDYKIPFSKSAFFDMINSTLMLGSAKNTNDYFKGFIYSFEIYIESPPISSLSSIACENCKICLNTNTYLPNCNITSFFNHTLLRCEPCLPECNNGCRNEFNCNLCENKLCKVCNDFVSAACTQCFNPFELKGKSCVSCNSSSYYNESLQKCTSCNSLCSSCKSYDTCNNCILNSHKTEKDTCECDKGYLLNTKCERIKFRVSLTINTANIVTLLFTERLLVELTSNDISVIMNSIPQIFHIEFIDLSTYNIITEFNSSIQAGDRIFIIFIHNIVSESNSLLDLEEILSIRLFLERPKDNQGMINSKNEYIKFGVTSTFYTVAVLSIINLDLSLLFNFLNSAELFTYIKAYQVEIHPMLSKFLDGIQIISGIPSVFSETISESYGIQLPKKYTALTGPTNLFILNSGVNLIILSSFIAATPVAWLMSKIKLPKNSQLLKRLWQGFTFNIFLRIFIQSCLEFVFKCSISLFYNDLSNRVLITDFLVSIIIITANILTFGWLLGLIKYRSRLFGNTSALEDYNKKFGAFFLEFKENNSLESFYYVLFVLRRYAIVIGILFINSAITQLCISATFGLATLFYLIEVKPYKDVITNIYMISIEVATSLFYIILIVSCVPESHLDLLASSYCCILLLVVAVTSNILSGLVSSFVKLLGYLKKKRSLRVSTTVSNITIPTFPQTENALSKNNIIYSEHL